MRANDETITLFNQFVIVWNQILQVADGRHK